MIEHNIHYCWFGSDSLPDELQSYVEGWSELYPDYNFYCWNENTFNIDESIPFVKEAYKEKKYAFVADYVRMWALYKYGGIYMDTDVKLLRRFDELMCHRFFTAMEYHESNVRILNIKDKLTEDGHKKNPKEIIYDICIESSVFAAEKKHPFIKDCLDYYDDKHFILKDGSYYDQIIVPVIMALEAEKYGFSYINDFQTLKEGMYLMPDEYFTHPTKQTSNTIGLHMVKNSWRNYSKKQRVYLLLSQNKVVKSVYNFFDRIPLIRRCFDYTQKIVWLNGRNK